MQVPVVVTARAGMLVGLDALTGARVFEHRIGSAPVLGGLARLVHRIELAVTEHRIYAVAGGTVHAFEYPSGRALGSVALSEDTWARPSMLVHGGQLFVSIGHRLHALDAEGRLLWSADVGDRAASDEGTGIAVPGAVRTPEHDRR